MQKGHMIINRNLQRNRCTSSVLSVSLFLCTLTVKFNPRVKDFLMSLGNFYSQTGKTVNTRNISGMLLWCKKKVAIRPEETKLRARTLISLWFCGLHACPDLYSD